MYHRDMRRKFSIPVLVIASSAALSMSPIVSNAAPVGDGSQPQVSADVKTGEVKASEGESAAAIAYLIDVKTGEELASKEMVGKDRSYRRGNCRTGDACWTSDYPVGDFAFFNKGTNSGRFPQRQSFYTGKYYAKICWLYGSKTVCSKTFIGPNKTIYLYGSDKGYVTGVSVTLK